MRASWKRTNLPETHGGISLTRIMKITLQEKDEFIESTKTLVHKFIPMPQAMKYQMQKQQWIKNAKTWEIGVPGAHCGRWRQGCWESSVAWDDQGRRSRKAWWKSRCLGRWRTAGVRGSAECRPSSSLTGLCRSSRPEVNSSGGHSRLDRHERSWTISAWRTPGCRSSRASAWSRNWWKVSSRVPVTLGGRPRTTAATGHVACSGRQIWKQLLLLTEMEASMRAMRVLLPVQRDETTSERWRDWKSLVARSLSISSRIGPWRDRAARNGSWRRWRRVEESPPQHRQRWKTHVRADDGDRSVQHDVGAQWMLRSAWSLRARWDENWLWDVASLSRRARPLAERRPTSVRSSLWSVAGLEIWWRPSLGPPCRQQAAGRGQRYEGKAQTCWIAWFGPCPARERREDDMTATRGRGLASALVDAEEDGMHELKAHGSRQRGLFSLPCENDLRKMRSGLSRGFRQRAGRRRELCERVSEMAHALNSLYEEEDFPRHSGRVLLRTRPVVCYVVPVRLAGFPALFLYATCLPVTSSS